MKTSLFFRIVPLFLYKLQKFHSDGEIHAGGLRFFLLIISLVTVHFSSAQVIRTIGPAGADYPNLRTAFNNINNGSLTGSIIFKITGSVTESSSAVLNASGTGNPAASYSSVLIYPTVSGAVISCNFNGPLIELNGAGNLIIDGRINASGSNSSLILRNSKSSANDEIATITFQNGADSNTIRYCSLQGCGSGDMAGIVRLMQGSSQSGNNSNLLENNVFTGTTNDRPVHAIVSIGSAQAGLENTGNQVTGNHFYNFLHQSRDSDGILLGSGNTSWSINGNSFFETAPLTTSGADKAYTIIRLDCPSATGMNISGNYIGGRAALCAGQPWTKTNAKNDQFTAISVNVGTSSESFVTLNTIRNFSWSNSGNATWTAILISGGRVSVGGQGGNIIGSLTVDNSIQVSSGGSSALFYGIHITGSGTVECHNNQVGSVTTTHASVTRAVSICGICKDALAGDLSVAQNTIGSAVSTGMIRASSASTGATQFIIGIRSEGSGTNIVQGNQVAGLSNSQSASGIASMTDGIRTTAGQNTISGNTISNLTSGATGNDPGSGSVVAGIAQLSTQGVQVISQNSIYALSGTATVNASAGVSGIVAWCNSVTSGEIAANFIHSLSLASGSSSTTTPFIDGIHFKGGKVLMVNNIVSLNSGTGGGKALYGIRDAGDISSSRTLLFNTIYLTGTASGTNAPTAGLYSGNGGSRDFRNNYSQNLITGGISGRHYALVINAMSGLTIDYNDYHIASGGMLARVAGVEQADLSSLRSATGQDLHSFSLSPEFVQPGSSGYEGYFPQTILAAATGTGISTDFTGTFRKVVPKIGALERSSFTWKGTINTDFSVAGNWLENSVPAGGEDIVFDAAPVNHCQLDQERTVGDIINAQSNKRMDINGKRLNLQGELVFSSGARMEAVTAGSLLVFDGGPGQSIHGDAFTGNKVRSMQVDNPENVVLKGQINILGILSPSAGRFDALMESPSLVFQGNEPQSIISGVFSGDSIHDLTADNSSGVTIGSDLTVRNSLDITGTGKLVLADSILLTVQGQLVNAAGADGFLFRSGPGGTARLLHNSDAIPATVERYITGQPEEWHFLSAPVNGQVIAENEGEPGSWLPSGTYGNGTGYDLYAWNEPTWCWIYKLNTTSAVNWNTIHPSADFAAGRGYLYSVQAENPVKTFSGNLNNGSVEFPVTMSPGNDGLQGFCLTGNPYPSTIDWCTTQGWDREDLLLSGGGFDAWIWNPSANNYGVINSLDTDGSGTNGITRYISPMQGFFVRAARPGILGFNNGCRTPEEVPWLKSSVDESQEIKVRVDSREGAGFDEILVRFNCQANENGARKLFSEVSSAPGLYMVNLSDSLSVRYAVSPQDTPAIPVCFLPGSDGEFTISAEFDPGLFPAVMLEDKKLHLIHDLKAGNKYRFDAARTDNSDRFVLRTAPDPAPESGDLPARVFCDHGQLVFDLSLVYGETSISVFQLTGRRVVNLTVEGGLVHRVNMDLAAQLLIVWFKNPTGDLKTKVLWLRAG